jgi:hypothetical protein
MRAKVYSTLVANPINFPDDLTFTLFPLRSHDDTQIGPSIGWKEHYSWAWVQRRYPVNSEGEARIKAGESIRVHTGWVTAEFPARFEFPEGSEVTILEP